MGSRKMNARRVIGGLALAGLVSCLVAALQGGENSGQEGNATKPQTEAVPVMGARITDMSKSVKIERPVVNLAAGSSSRAATSANPKVEPGKVHWHKDFAEACAASKKSGKPVLLFQMMGKLDDQFC